jgi:hypothetical protein
LRVYRRASAPLPNIFPSNTFSPKTGSTHTRGSGRERARVAPAISWPARSRGFFRRRGR